MRMRPLDIETRTPPRSSGPLATGGVSSGNRRLPRRGSVEPLLYPEQARDPYSPGEEARDTFPSSPPPLTSPGGNGSVGGDYLFGAATNRAGFRAAIHSTTNRIGRHLGFQAFNVIPDTADGSCQSWTPATIHLVSDHLENLLVGNMFRRDTTPGSEVDRFANCVADLHDNIMTGYQDWCDHVDLPMRVPEVEFAAFIGSEPQKWEWQLEELAMYFLLHSEASNLRHLPECLWFILWCMRNSINKMKQACCPESYSALSVVNDKQSHNVIDRRVELRNQYHVEIAHVRRECGVEEQGANHSAEELDIIIKEAREKITSSNDFNHIQYSDLELLVEMVAFGDHGCFLDKVVQPLFECLALAGKQGEDGVEIACRMGYDDFNESFATRKNVREALEKLGVTVDRKTNKVHLFHGVMQRGPYGALLDIGLPAGPTGSAREMPKKGAAVHLGEETMGPALSCDPKDWDSEIGRTWWQTNVLGKTFIECRSFLMVFRAFFRVIAFHVLWFQLLASLAWTHGSWFVASFTLLTHALLSFLEQVARWYTQRAPSMVGDARVKLHGRSRLGQYAGILMWLVVNAGLWFCLVWVLLKKTRVVWWIGAAAYAAAALFHGVVSSRSGYMVSSWHEIADGFERFSRRKRVPTRLFSGIGSLFRLAGSSSSHPSAKEYLAPLRMKMPVSQGFFNLLFWLVVLSLKGVFDWFAVIAPLEDPVKGLWDRRWLSAGKNANQGADGDILLVIARVLPAFLLSLVDTGIFYSIVSAAVGVSKGLFWLNLGITYSYTELRNNFHGAAEQFWERIISADGAQQITNSGENKARPASRVPPSLSKQQQQLRESMRHIPPEVTQAGTLPLLSHQSMQARAGQQHARAPFSRLRGSPGFLGDVNEPKWRTFSLGWNQIVEELYFVDLLSSLEKRNLLFVQLDLNDSVDPVEGMRTFMLPAFFNAGNVASAADASAPSEVQQVALCELRALMVWILRELGLFSVQQAKTLLAFTPLRKETPAKGQSQLRVKTITSLVDLLKTLQGLTKVRPNERLTLIDAFKKQIATILKTVEAEAQAVEKLYKSAPEKRAPAQAVLLLIESIREDLAEQPCRFKKGDGDGYGGPFRLLHPEANTTSEGENLKKKILKKAINQLLLVLSDSGASTAPHGKEAQRILAWFMSSLRNPQLKRPPPVHHMLSLNTLTPHYGEDVLYSLAKKDTARSLNMPENKCEGLNDLITETADGVSPMTYIRSLYRRDWENFLARMEETKPGSLCGIEASKVSEEDFCEKGALSSLALEVQQWASLRGQHLARTVRGMMAYESALMLLARWETPKPDDISQEDYDRWLEDLIASKYTYVVASQNYGNNKKSGNVANRWLARGVEKLLHLYPTLRNAYIESGSTQKGGALQWAVLVRNNGHIPQAADSCVDEVYRVRLPRNPVSTKGVIVGEGKPENQNAAFIFCLNEIVQAIDMNQDNFLAEAFKIRNLVSEFTPEETIKDKRKKLHKGGAAIARGASAPQLAGHSRKQGHQPIACVGMREWIFSENSGAVASFAAATEFTFGTIVQRVMSWPGGVRFHYGHPDLWNKLFIMTRGGVSKPTKSFHISEDVFAGYNHTLRGASIKFLEYIQVGKGRDMGMDSVLGFERKVASGNGEQALSRDAYRLGTQFDFPRLLAWYHTGIGFFVNTYLIFLTVSASIWVYLLLALSDSQTYPCGPPPRKNETQALCSTITGQAAGLAAGSVIQIGALTIATYAVELLLERGFVIAMGSLLYQFLQGSIMFGIFRSRTSGFAFKDDIQNGGAAYVATGRGYALTHLPFTVVYTSYARSHLYYSVQLVMLLVLLAAVSTQEYISSTWGAWLVAVCLMAAPFWFNPQTFSMTTTKKDFSAWRLWMSDVYDHPSKSTWATWNKKQLAPLRNEKDSKEGGRAQHPWINSLSGFLSSVPQALLVLGATTALKNTKINRYALFGITTAAVYVLVISVVILRSVMRSRFQLKSWRITRMVMLVVVIVAVVVFAFVIVPRIGSSSSGFRNVIIIVFANFQIAVLVGQALLYFGSRWGAARYYVNLSYRSLDYIIGYLLFAFLFLFSFVGFVGRIQSALLFNVKFVKELNRGRLMGPYVQVVVERLHRERVIKEEKRKAEAGRAERMAQNAADGLRTRTRG